MNGQILVNEIQILQRYWYNNNCDQKCIHYLVGMQILRLLTLRQSDPYHRTFSASCVQQKQYGIYVLKFYTKVPKFMYAVSQNFNTKWLSTQNHHCSCMKDNKNSGNIFKTSISMFKEGLTNML